MGMVVKNNISALNTLNTMNRNNNALSKSLEKVSSGMKINSAADDASGYAISERMRVQIRSLDQANQNAQNGNKLLKTAEGAVSSTLDILKTLKEKVVNAANDTNTTADRQIIQDELNQAIDQINDNASVTFNGKTLVDGSMNKAVVTATTSAFTNQSLGSTTASNSQLTALVDRNGNTLDIKASDKIKVSFVQNGRTFTTEYTVSNTSLSTIFTNASTAAGGSFGFGTTILAASAIGKDATGTTLFTADGGNAITVISSKGGTEGQVSGFSISVSGVDGNVKKSINEKLDDFSNTIRAQDKSNNNALTLQIGTQSNQSINVGLSDMRAKSLGLQGSDPITGTVKNIDITTKDNANAAINVLDTAITKVLSEQTKIGSVQNRLEYTSANLTTASENVSAAESTIRDANMAKEMTEFTKNNILMQASQAMLAQANQSTQNVLSLLQ
jgi:flagellin